MKSILARESRAMLERLASSDVLLGFDFDGTLAPIVADPAKARLRGATRRLFAQLALRYPCVVISGRARDDVARRLMGIAVAEVIGNHGSEPSPAEGALRAQVARWRPELSRALAPWRGVLLEDKGLSLALHFRRSREKNKARAAILAVAAGLPKVRLIGGKQVMNLVPVGAPHKGIAFEQTRARQACDSAMFIGDDETDEDVFAFDRPGQLITVRVGASRRSGAAYCVRDQAEVDLLLRRMLELRAPGRRR